MQRLTAAVSQDATGCSRTAHAISRAVQLSGGVEGWLGSRTGLAPRAEAARGAFSTRICECEARALRGAVAQLLGAASFS